MVVLGGLGVTLSAAVIQAAASGLGVGAVVALFARRSVGIPDDVQGLRAAAEGGQLQHG